MDDVELGLAPLSTRAAGALVLAVFGTAGGGFLRFTILETSPDDFNGVRSANE